MVIRRLRHVRPDDTLLHTAYLPSPRPPSRYSKASPAAAIEQLRPAVRHERGIVAALMPAYLRGEARLAPATPGGRPGISGRPRTPRRRPVLTGVPLAQLGLARALVRGGDEAAGRAAYDAVLRMWSTADADLPALMAARREAAALVR